MENGGVSMKNSQPLRLVTMILCHCTGALLGQSLEEIVDISDVHGGFVVQVGCGTGPLTFTLARKSNYQIQVLDANHTKVAQLRGRLREKGLYGKVTVDVFNGETLPYVDNLVNLIVLTGDLDETVPLAEMKRTLSPLGAIVKVQGDQVTRVHRKPWPDDIGEWTHYLCDASNNAVAADTRIGPPKQFQWMAGPKWCRTHDHLASMSALVSTQGRIFYILDEGPTAMAALPPRWMLIARDAFSGVVLWKRPIREWEGHLRGFRSGPTELQRRLVAVGNRVFVTLGYGEPVTALDAAKGKTLAVYPQTENALEMIVAKNRLFVLVGDRKPDNKARQGRSIKRINEWMHWSVYKQAAPDKSIVAIDLGTGQSHWIKADRDTREILPMTMVCQDNTLYFQNYETLAALDTGTGKTKWSTARPVNRRRPEWSVPTIVVSDGVVISADRSLTEAADGIPAQDVSEKIWLINSRGGHAPSGEMIAFSTQDGQELWRALCKECYNAPVDILVVDGLVWSGELVQRKEAGITQALDLHTGKVKFTRPQDQGFYKIIMGHHRCYRNKATTNYLMLGRDGTEYIDVKTGALQDHHWFRGVCQYGVMPANGLTYSPPHACACHIESKLNSFLALSSTPHQIKKRAPHERLIRGKAYPVEFSSIAKASDSWPTYRQNNLRSGKADTLIETRPKLMWQTELGGDLSQPVIAHGRVLVACQRTNSVFALDVKNGRILWMFTAGAAVDSAPTLYQGRALFGCRDGWVYCLRVEDGALMWRYLAAPDDRRIMAYGKPESPWPIHGSVLVQDSVVHAAVGRTPYLEGGLGICRLDAMTGEPLSSRPIQTRALPDVLSSDGDRLYMRHLVLDKEGRIVNEQKLHLYSSAGFLDGDWWHRTYWLYGMGMKSNYGGWPQIAKIKPAGRLLVLDGDKVYGYGRLNQYSHIGSHVGLGHTRNVLYAASIHQRVDEEKRKSLLRWNNPEGGVVKSLWSQPIPVWARGMLMSAQTLFVAGPPDYLNKDRAQVKDPYTLAPPELLQTQQEALQGERGGLLCGFSTQDGTMISKTTMPAPPVWDGMAAGEKRLILSLVDGQVLCYGK